MAIIEPSPWQLMDCDRCGFTFKRVELLEQKGYLVCDECFDDPNPQEGDRGD
mgnify:FL=1